MNPQLKTRLVGAIVLISLAVIFIPMMLDGGAERAPMVGEFIPDRPDYHFEPLDIPLQPVPVVPAEQPRLVDPPPAKDSQPEPVAPESKPEAPAKPADVAPAPVAPSPRPAAVPTPPSGSDTPAWVVQVGSFSQQDNAVALRDRLRKAGFPAFVDQATAAGSTTWRVRVGPELKRENAERLQQRLQQQMQLQGIVVGHKA